MKSKKKEIDYINLYGKQLREDPETYWKQHKMLIDSQIKASQSFFSNFGTGEEFKRNARKYAKERGLL